MNTQTEMTLLLQTLVDQNKQILEKLEEQNKPKSRAKSKDGSSDSSEKLAKPSVAIPFCGEIYHGRCSGIVVNHQLFTQCLRAPLEDGEYCSSCVKTICEEGGVPKNGHISTRHLPNFQCGDRSPVSYGNVMEKLKITRQQAEEAVAEFSAHFPSMNGMTIPEEQFEIVKKPRGRPKKEKTEPENQPEKVKKPRGRPKKEKTVIHASEESTSIIEQMVAEAQAESEPPAESEPNFPPASACVSAQPKPSDEEKKARREAKKAQKKEKEKEEQNRKLAAEAKAKEEAEIAEQLREIGLDSNPDDSNPEEELSDLDIDFGDESEPETTNADDLD